MIIKSTHRDSMGYPQYPKQYYDIKNKFVSAVSGTNFMTPYIYGYWESGEIVAEISEAGSRHKMIMGENLFGVTVVKNGVKDNDLCAAFTTIEQVENYLTELSK